MNFNLYQYTRDIEVVIQDGDNNSTMTQFLGNMPMYDTTHKLHKGIDNTLRFKFRDTDRKSVDLTGKTVIWKMYDRESRENVLFRYLTLTNATKGMAMLEIPTSDTILLPEGFYQFAMYTVEDGVEQIIYTDTNDNAHGVLEVLDDVYPEFEDSQETATFFDDGTKLISTVFDGAGNTIKSKKLPLYIEDFLDKGVKQLLEGKGQEFVEWYYEYINKIFNKEIPLMKIAQRAKVKLSVDDYKKRLTTKTKAGNSMSRMAHMELALQENLAVNLGDVIMYVNNGLRASHGDVQKKGDGVQINCYMLSKDILENNPNLTGDYNVPRAITTFNKRMEPLMVVFQDEVRNNLIVNDPEKRGIFTKSQCELINGHPLGNGDQDRLQEDVLDISEGELKYWSKRGIDPNYIYDLASEGWEEHII